MEEITLSLIKIMALKVLGKLFSGFFNNFKNLLFNIYIAQSVLLFGDKGGLFRRQIRSFI